MRVITPAQAAVLANGTQSEHLRLSVKDSGGTFRDLTTYVPGVNMVKTVQVSAKVDNPHATFEAELARDLFKLSLAPLMQDSALNRGFSPSAPYAALLALQREVLIEVAIVGADRTPGDDDWMELFRGRIDDIDAASGANIRISGRDLSGKLATTYIKKERVYAFAIVGGEPVSLRIWAPEMVVEEGEYVLPASRGAGSSDGGPEDPGYNKFFVVEIGGTTGTEEPTWAAIDNIFDGTAKYDYAGAPSTAGVEVEKIIQLILNDNPGAGAGTITTVGDPDWLVGQFFQQRGPVLDAVRALATQNGWDFRSKWSEDDEAFVLTLYEPERDDPDVLHTFAVADYEQPRKLSTSVQNIRNSVDVIFEDETSLWPDGSTARKVVHAQDDDSIAELADPDTGEGGEFWAELQEDENSAISTVEEAERYAAAFISDCSRPDADLSVPLTRGFPWVELNDFVTFTANHQHFSTDQSVAITAFRHSWGGSRLKTEVDTRGKPTLGAQVHIEKTFHPWRPPKDKPHRLQTFQGDTTPSARIEPTVGGANITVELSLDKQRLIEEYEHHIYETPGTPLSDATFFTISKSRTIEVGHLQPGAGYTHRVIPRTYNAGKLVRGQPSVEVTFAAGRGQAGHLRQEVEWGRLPLNGGFETWDADVQMPDHWGTNDIANFRANSGSGGVSGNLWISFIVSPSPGNPEIFSDQFSVERGMAFDLKWWVKAQTSSGTSTTGKMALAIRWYDFDGAVLSTDQVDEVGLTASVLTDGMTDGVWYNRGGTATAPDDARFGAVIISKTEATDDPGGFGLIVHVDSVRFERA